MKNSSLVNYLLNSSNLLKINSKDIQKGDVFLALSGTKYHGNIYIKEAIKKGASYIITDKIEKKNTSKKIINVKNSIIFLREICKKKRQLFKGIVVGITGSIGKTSTKENLKFFLEPYFKIYASIKSYNNELGVIVSLINLDLKSNFAIFEMGTNNFFEIEKLTKIILPQQVIITNIYPTHLEKLKSTRNIANEKSDIFNCNYNTNVQLAILSNSNIDEKFIVSKAKKSMKLNVLTFGKYSNSNLKIHNTTNIDSKYVKVILKYFDNKITIEVNKNIIDRIDNILICLLFFLSNNIEIKLFNKMTRKIPLIEGRGLVNKVNFQDKKINFIDESYNASPQSMKVCVNYLKDIKNQKNQKKFLVLGDMNELGEKSLNYHIELLNYINKKKLKNVVICGKIMQSALENTKGINILYFSNIKLIKKYLGLKMNNNDILLIKGSNSSLTNKLAKTFLTLGKK